MIEKQGPGRGCFVKLTLRRRLTQPGQQIPISVQVRVGEMSASAGARSGETPRFSAIVGCDWSRRAARDLSRPMPAAASINRRALVAAPGLVGS
jgi:hypothetical protein